jgi:hypothetical protein
MTGKNKQAKYQNRRRCYVCGGKLIWDSEELFDDDEAHMRFEIYLHCVSCKAMVLYAIPIINKEDEEE